jgi:NADPH:quinone reductase
MKAMLIHEFGSADKFHLAELPDHPPGKRQALIQVRASSVNPIDLKIRSGLVPAVAPDFPAALNVDVAGDVLEIGSEVLKFKVGDRVAAMGGGVKGHDGALSEMMRIDADLLAKIPDGVSYEQAAAMPVVGLTSWEALVNRGRIKSGQKVLIHGGAGGVGHIAVQLASAMGAEVTATVSGSEKAAIARRMGAHHIVNYKEQSVKEYVQEITGGQGFDIIVDTAGGSNLDKSFEAAALSGSVITTNTRSTNDLSLMHGKGLTLHVVFLLLPLLFGKGKKEAGENLEKLLVLVQEDKISPMIYSRTFGFSEIKLAHELIEQGGYFGKISLVNDL